MILPSLLYAVLLGLWLSIRRRERKRVERVAKKQRTWAVVIT